MAFKGKWLSALFLLLGVLPAVAQVLSSESTGSEPISEATQQKRINDFRHLFRDPHIRLWIELQAEEITEPAADTETIAPTEASPDVVARQVTAWEAMVRDHVRTMILAIPNIPGEIQEAFLRLRADAIGNDHASLSLTLFLLVGCGMTVEWLVRRKCWCHGNGLQHYVPIVIFAAIMTAVFFVIDWPSLVRLVIACYLVAFVAYRFAAAMIGHIAGPKIRGRLKITVGLLLVALASAISGAILQVEESALRASEFIVSCIALALALELAWFVVSWSIGARIVLCFYVAGVWLLWCLGLRELFWIGIYIAVLPPMLRAVTHVARQRMAEHFLVSPSDSRSILMVRGIRAVLIGLAIAWFVLVWELDDQALGHGDPRMAAWLDGLIKGVFVLLLADLVWHLVKAAIDRNILPSTVPTPPGVAAEEAGTEVHATRLHTLLPILRNVLGVAIFVVAGLVILGQLGVDIGPLIAGAGIVGVAIGFGSQALVRDVISGIFYLFDDAFRVGEYIQAKNYKGTVEGFSLRSVKLRHHRGPIFTVPFGELGAVENMSRDWSKVKFVVTVPYDTDLDKARRIGKTIGQELLSDPELGPLFIQPLKMKGVEEFGEYGIVLSFAMVTIPTGQQSFIRRTAYAKLREAFQKNGMAFAQPTIQLDDRLKRLTLHNNHGTDDARP